MPRGLAVTSAITLRVIIVVGGLVLLGLFAKLMMVVVLPVVILIAVTAGGVLAGVAGAFLAIPVAAVTSAVHDYVRAHRAEQRTEAVLAP